MGDAMPESFRLTGTERYEAVARGARSAFDVSGLGLLRDGLFPAPAWTTLDPWRAVARDMARVIDRFGRGAACARRALLAGDDIDRLPAGCVQGVEPYRLPLRHVTATHASVGR
jgi:hypothetical protein